MTEIAKAFENGKAFIPFITCGDPDLETTAKVVREAVANGADLIELGIPFSDPTAEGPVIQGANIRALKGGVTTDKVFDLVRELRKDVTVPMVFMTYANVVFSYGADKFISTCKEIGINGLILPDLPYEEKDEFLPLCKKYGVDLISLIAPTSENRIAMIAKEADGFIYLVDRKKDVVISGGENIYPVQIEDFLRRNDKIKDVAVIGIPDSRLGEITAAIIELKDGMTCTEEEINDFCEELPRYKRPKKIIFEKVPRNPTGKIEKPVLRAKYCKGRLVESQITG